MKCSISTLLFLAISIGTVHAQNVGIGTATPTVKLEIKGDNGTDLLNVKDDASNSRLYIQETGEVGIGTATPQYKLDVNGNIRLQNDDNWIGMGSTVRRIEFDQSQNRIDMESADVTINDGRWIGVDGSSPRMKMDDGNGRLVFKDANMELDDSKWIGLNASNPRIAFDNTNDRLDLRDTDVEVDDNSWLGIGSTVERIEFGGSNDEIKLTGGTVNINGAYTLPTSDASSGGKVLKTDGSGNVSWDNPNNLVNGDNLGNHTATQNLIMDVHDINMTNANSHITFENPGGKQMQLGDDVGTTSGIGVKAATNPNPGNPIFVVKSAGGSERLRVDHAGALKTSNRLEVEGTGNSYIKGKLKVGNPSNSGGTLNVLNRISASYGNTNHYGYFEGRTSSNKRGFYLGYGDGGQEVDLRLDNASELAITGGNVGIGNASPSEKLDVLGNVKITGDLNITGNIKLTGKLTSGNIPWARLTNVPSEAKNWQTLGKSGNSITLTNGSSVTAPYADEAGQVDWSNVNNKPSIITKSIVESSLTANGWNTLTHNEGIPNHKWHAVANNGDINAAGNFTVTKEVKWVNQNQCQVYIEGGTSGNNYRVNLVIFKN